MTGDDEQLLRDLGRAVRARERTSDEERLQALAAGELSSAERTALDQAAQRDPALLRAATAYAPLPESMQQRIAEQIATALHTQRTARAPRRLLLRSAAMIAPLAVAAAAALWLTRPVSTAVQPPLPTYALEVKGSPAEFRGATQSAAREANAPVRIASDTRLQIVLRPSTAVAAQVLAAAYLVQGAADPVPWQAEVATSTAGAVRVSLAPIPTPITGPAELRIVLGNQETLAHGRELAQGSADRGPGFQRFHVALTPIPSP